MRVGRGSMITNPKFRPDSSSLDLLYRRKREEFDPGFPKTVGAGVVKGVTERIAEEACEALLRQLEAQQHKWVSANAVRRNQRGYDYLVNDKIRVQVKGTDTVEQVGWAHKPDITHPSFDFDVLVFVHVGACLDTSYGKFAKYNWKAQPFVDYYIIPNEIIRQWVGNPRYLNKGRVELYWNRRPYPADSKQHMGQTREILEYRDRFDHLVDLL